MVAFILPSEPISEVTWPLNSTILAGDAVFVVAAGLFG
jgi:hypothetical protein